MARRRFLAITAGVTAVVLVAAACTKKSETDEGPPKPGAKPSGTLRLFSYSDGFDKEYIASFHEMYPDIDLETAGFSSNSQAISKLLAGFEADVVNSCVDEATLEMVNMGLYAPLDVSRLENWDDIFEKMKELPGVVVDGKPYIVPVDAGTAGILYNADEITEPPDAWADLFDPAYAGRVGLENLDVTAIDIGALVLGIEDPLNMDQTQLDQVKNYLIENKSQFRTFWNSQGEIKNLFKSGEVVIASGYPDYAEFLQEEGVNVKFTLAKEGQMLWTCGYGISSDADPENIDAAYALLNWYTSVPPQLYAAENFLYQTSNSKILEEASPELIEKAALDSFAETSGQGGEEVSPLIPATPPEDHAAWRAAWSEVRAS